MSSSAPATPGQGRSGGWSGRPATTVAAAPPWLLLTEPATGSPIWRALPLAAPWLAFAPRGDGHGVLVLPGLLATDTSTGLLRQFLRRLGYQVRGWRLGRNLGPTSEVLAGLPGVLSAPGGPAARSR